MGEAADVTNNLSVVLLMWLWWTFIALLEMAIRKDDSGEPLALSAPEADNPSRTGDQRFDALARMDPAFSASAFLEGAGRAYGIIVEAFAAGDMETLKPLVSSEVLAVFEDACAERARRGETIELTLIGIDRIDVANVEIVPDTMMVTLCFHAQLVRTEFTADGTVVGDGPPRLIETAERWIFGREIPVAGNTWTLLATGA